MPHTQGRSAASQAEMERKPTGTQGGTKGAVTREEEKETGKTMKMSKAKKMKKQTIQAKGLKMRPSHP